jgi:hypothetical protein
MSDALETQDDSVTRGSADSHKPDSRWPVIVAEPRARGAARARRAARADDARRATSPYYLCRTCIPRCVPWNRRAVSERLCSVVGSTQVARAMAGRPLRRQVRAVLALFIAGFWPWIVLSTRRQSPAMPSDRSRLLTHRASGHWCAGVRPAALVCARRAARINRSAALPVGAARMAVLGAVMTTEDASRTTLTGINAVRCVLQGGPCDRFYRSWLCRLRMAATIETAGGRQ